LKTDIGEQNDLANNLPDKLNTLHLSLQQYLKDVNAGLPRPNPEYDPATAAQTDTPGRRSGTGGRAGSGGPRQAQIAERKKQVEALAEALKQDDLEKMVQLVGEMKRRMEGNARPRSQRAGQQSGPSLREQRRQQLQQLEALIHRKDRQKLAELIAEMKNRLENPAPGPQRRRPGQRRSGQGTSGW
jgi:molecular chaperone DnaK (HSP70)